MPAALILLIILILGGNSVATYILIRSRHDERRQKLFQVLFVWFVPIVGALLVCSLAWDTSTNRVATDLTDNRGLDGYGNSGGLAEGIGRE